jgi:hypothetical protein
MLRKVIAAAVVGVLFVGVAFADQIRGVIVKVDGNKVTFAPVEGKGKDAKKGEEKTLPVAKDVKVTKGKTGDAVDGGVKNEAFSKIGKRGLPALITTDADNKTITEIRLFGGKKKQ